TAAGSDKFTPEPLHAQSFADAIAAVTNTSLTFLMCHKTASEFFLILIFVLTPKSQPSSFDFLDLYHSQFLAVADRLVITLPPLHFESDLLFAANMLEHIGHNRRAWHGRRADRDLAIVIDQQNT